MSKGSSKRQRQIRSIKARRQRKVVKLIGERYRAMLDSRYERGSMHGFTGEHGPELFDLPAGGLVTAEQWRNADGPQAEADKVIRDYRRDRGDD